MNRCRRLVRYPEIWVLTSLALLTRFWQIGWPSSIVFDEIYFRAFASNYLSGNYFFDIHPPLVKLLFAGVGALFQLSPAEVAAGEPGSVLLRLLPALAGAALVPLIYVILLQFRLDRRIAAFGAALVLFDNALMVESRFVLMDSLLLLFGFGALSAYLALRRSKDNRRWIWVMIVAFFLGALVTTKWSGLAIVGTIGLAWICEGILRRWQWHRMLAEATVVIAIMTWIYVGSFMMHFALLTHSGEGDAFMSQNFQATLVDNTHYDPSKTMSFWKKFAELNIQMYDAQSTLNSTTHPYASRWYAWPLMTRPVYYWQSEVEPGGMQRHIYLLGNPIVWLIGTAGVIVALFTWLFRTGWLAGRRKLMAFLLVGYAANILPFAFINRPMFLYHYLFAYIFSILIVSVLYEELHKRVIKRFGEQKANLIYWIAPSLIVLGFLFFLPLSYGWPLSPDDLSWRMWLPHWR